ncbi:MAG: RNA polymerase sigma factor [Candidatus Poribacteria bacterium]
MIPDELWVKKAVEGDLSAFDEIVNRHHTKIYRLAYRLLGNAEDADDATQETFIEAYKSLKSFKYKSKFSTWLYRVALNTCHQQIRKAESRRRTLTAFADNVKFLDAENGIETPDNVALKKERQRLLQAAIDRLPERQKQVIVLFYMQNLKYREIAEILGCPEGTVASRLNTAIKNLKPKLKDL